MNKEDRRNDPARIAFCIKLANLRRELRLNQYDMEAKLNLPKGSISKIERGVREPTWREINLFADLFHVSLDYLAGKTTIRSPRRMDLFDYLKNHSFTDRQLTLLEDSLYENRRRYMDPYSILSDETETLFEQLNAENEETEGSEKADDTDATDMEG
ncbi:MAG: helix-turn-helix transcriptional regulator [Lachnospiraceae bacterium]|nr:helix-turn-helix transcriptional regulator [Lachnospiraceae bacterium]